ncbi:MAG: ComEC/Rec2 family competence protein [Clostridia bacterium]|nr:ComEC/Rec2 family competence protein [Clostridia bacterium]
MKKINFRWLFYPFLAFLLGLNSARKLFAGQVDYIVVLSLLILAVGGFCLFKKYYTRLIVLFLCLLVGGGYYFVGLSEFNVKDYHGSVAVVGRITDSIKDNNYSYTIILDNVKIDGEGAANVSVQVKDCADLPDVGSFIAFESKVTPVHAFTLESFNSSCYRNGVRYYAVCDFDNAVVSGGYQTFDETVRLRIKDLLHANMSEDCAETAYASLFGDKSSLDDEIYSAYQDAGIIHVLTVSGLHVSFLISLIYGLLKLCRVNKYASFAVTTIFIIFYAFLCNWAPSVCRAGIMGVAFMASKLLYRKYDGLNSLGLAGFILCLARPLNGLDIGFLMSVFCVMGIFVVMPLLSKLFAKFMPTKCADVFAVSIAAQIGILPIMSMMSASINPLSIFANFIIVPLFGVMFPFLFAVCFLGLILPFLGKCLVLVEYAFSAIFAIARFFAAVPKINLKPFDFAKILLFYIIFFILSDYFMALSKERLMIFAGLICAYALVFVGYYFTPSGLNAISYLTQYNSSSVILKNSKGNVMIVGDSYLNERLLSRGGEDFHIFVANKSLTQQRYSLYENYGVDNFVCWREGEYSESDVISLDKDYVIGGFKLTYLSNGAKMAGVRVNFDNLEIFIASDEKLSYNEFEIFDQKYEFDFVFADYSVKGNDDFIHISTEEVEGCDYNFNSYGNIAFAGANLGLRRLD